MIKIEKKTDADQVLFLANARTDEAYRNDEGKETREIPPI